MHQLNFNMYTVLSTISLCANYAGMMSVWVIRPTFKRWTFSSIGIWTLCTQIAGLKLFMAFLLMDNIRPMGGIFLNIRVAPSIYSYRYSLWKEVGNPSWPIISQFLKLASLYLISDMTSLCFFFIWFLQPIMSHTFVHTIFIRITFWWSKKLKHLLKLYKVA